MPKRYRKLLCSEVLNNYSYKAGQTFPHRRSVKWLDSVIERSAMSDALRNSTGSIGTVSDITKYADEAETPIAGNRPPVIITTDNSVENPTVFALEKHLEDFLVQNWKQTELGKLYDIYEEDGELVGQQYQSDPGPIDVYWQSAKTKKSYWL